MRGIAVCIVFAYHVQALWPEFFQNEELPLIPQLLFSPLRMGWCGVDLFFVLSGALITSILLETKSDPHYFRNFYARRTLRIFPLYYGVLLAIFVGLPLLAKLPISSALAALTSSEQYNTLWQAQPWFWTYTHNFYQAGGLHRAPGLGHFWTLAIEEQFYLLWPLIVYWLKPKQLLAICLLGCLGAFLLRIVLLATDSTAWAVWHLTPTRIDTLLFGALIAFAVQQQGHNWQRLCSPGVGIALALATVPIAIVSAGNAMHLVMQTCGYSALAMLFAWWIARQFRNDELGLSAPWWDNTWLRALGKWSYAIYIFHWPVLLVARQVYEKLENRYTQHSLGLLVSAILAASATTLLTAMISWYAYERHWLKLKTHFEPVSTSQSTTA